MKLFSLILLATFESLFVNYASSQCQSLNRTLFNGCLDAGYNVSEFSRSRTQDEMASLISSMQSKFQNCSASLSTLMTCSVHVPKCSTSSARLPCREVCRKFVRDCQGGSTESEGLLAVFRGLCELPTTDKCLPSSKQFNDTKTIDVTCHRLSISQCADAGYGLTSVSSAYQKMVESSNIFKVSDTNSTFRKVICMEVAPPCDYKDNGTLLVPCKSTCEAAFNESKSQFIEVFRSPDYCNAFPMNDSEHEKAYCRLQTWPEAGYWPSDLWRSIGQSFTGSGQVSTPVPTITSSGNVSSPVSTTEASRNVTTSAPTAKTSGNVSTTVPTTKLMRNPSTPVPTNKTSANVTTPVATTKTSGNVSTPVATTKASANVSSTVTTTKASGNGGVPTTKTIRNVSSTVPTTKASGNVSSTVSTTETSENVTSPVSTTKASGNVNSTVTTTKASGNVNSTVTTTKASGNGSTPVPTTKTIGIVSSTVSTTNASGNGSTPVPTTKTIGIVSSTVSTTNASGNGSTPVPTTKTIGIVSSTVSTTNASGNVSSTVSTTETSENVTSPVPRTNTTESGKTPVSKTNPSGESGTHLPTTEPFGNRKKSSTDSGSKGSPNVQANKGGGMSAGTISGIVLGVIAIVAAIVVGYVLFRRYKRRKNQYSHSLMVNMDEL